MSPVSGLTNVCERVFTVDGTFTVPTGALLVQAFIVGGGGGGGGGAIEAFPGTAGGGGGGGGYFKVATITSDAAATVIVSVGDGGDGGDGGGLFNAGVDGDNGQDSSVNWGTGSAAADGGGGGEGVSNVVAVGGSGGTNGPVADRRPGGAGLPDGGGGGGGGNGSIGATANANDGGDGGAGARPASSQVLFGNLTRDYGSGGGGGDGDGGDGGTGGSGGGGAGGSGAAGTAGTANTGGGGGGGGVSGGGGQAGAAGGSGLVIIRVSFGSVIAAPVASRAPEVSLSLIAEEGVTCEMTSVSGRRGEWVELPAADSCSNVDATSNTVVLGWATSASFPVAIAQRQVDNGWGAYETFDNDGRLTSVFIPAGGSTLLSASGSLFAISGG